MQKQILASLYIVIILTLSLLPYQAAGSLAKNGLLAASTLTKTPTRKPTNTPTKSRTPTKSPVSTSNKTRTPTKSPTPTLKPIRTPTKVPSATPTLSGLIWKPSIGTSWQWQLDTPVDLSIKANVYDIDMFDNDASVVGALHAQGSKVVCYISVGSWENWRPDAQQFPVSVIGKDYQGWPGEKWLDIRQINLLAPIMRARLDQCKAKGFDAVEPDNIDSYQEDTGFPLSASDQIRYNTWLATEAHQRGLSIGLKNDSDQVSELLPYFDWALTEDCYAQGWCSQITPFITAGKAVLAAEYTDTGVKLTTICPQATSMHFSVILKNRELDAYRGVCP